MYNSDGYVLIDLTGVDITKTNQHLIGIYNRVLTVIDINKFALVINAGDLTPMAAVVHKKLNYYVINTPLYIFTINSNDIIMIEEAGEATVDVAIVPALLDGVKIADFTIGAVEGSLYAPEQQSEINDNITTNYTTWSSDKINTALSSKANAADVYTKAQVDTSLAAKANAADVYTKAQVDTALSGKQNSLTIEDISSGITFTSLENMTAINVISAYKYGKTVDIFLQPEFDGAAIGSNHRCIINFTNNNNRPKAIATTSMFQGTAFFNANLESSGLITIRDFGSSGSLTPYMRFIYICN